MKCMKIAHKKMFDWINLSMHIFCFLAYFRFEYATKLHWSRCHLHFHFAAHRFKKYCYYFYLLLRLLLAIEHDFWIRFFLVVFPNVFQMMAIEVFFPPQHLCLIWKVYAWSMRRARALCTGKHIHIQIIICLWSSECYFGCVFCFARFAFLHAHKHCNCMHFFKI